eukprot:749898-Rhodomonas_salina.1
MKGLAYLHGLETPLAHRDVCLANLLVAADGNTLKLADLSMAVPANGTGAKTHFRRGALRYTAPEVDLDATAAPAGVPGHDATKADVYSAALCCWCMVFGAVKPFAELVDEEEVRREVRRGQRPELRSGREEEQSVAKVLGAGWAPDPQNRPPS